MQQQKALVGAKENLLGRLSHQFAGGIRPLASTASCGLATISSLGRSRTAPARAAGVDGCVWEGELENLELGAQRQRNVVDEILVIRPARSLRGIAALACGIRSRAASVYNGKEESSDSSKERSNGGSSLRHKDGQSDARFVRGKAVTSENEVEMKRKGQRRV